MIRVDVQCGGGTGCLCSSLTIYLSTLSFAGPIDLLCSGGAGGHGLWGVFVFVGEVRRSMQFDYWDSFKLGRDLAGKDSKGVRIFWVQKVFVSLGSERF